MPYSPDHKSKTRIRILNAATALFKKNGFETVTIDHVMAAAGLTRGGFYAHFKNKEDLFVACVENGMSFLSSPVLAKLRQAERAGEDWVTSFASLYLSRLHIDNPEMGCALPTLSADVARSGDRAKNAFSKLINQASEKLAWKLAKEDDVPGLDRHLAAETDHDAAPRNVPAHYEQAAMSMLATMVGAVVLGRSVDEETANNILSAARDSIPGFSAGNRCGETQSPPDQAKKPLRTSA